MLVILFFAAFILILTNVYLAGYPAEHSRSYTGGRPPGERPALRRSILVSAVVTGSLIVFSTEGASLFSGLSKAALTVFWAAVCAGAGFSAYRAGLRGAGLRRAGLRRAVLRGAVSGAAAVRRDYPALSHFETALVLFVLAILSAELVTALAAAPNTWDSMTYHLSRVEHWIQARSVAHYPTNISRQLYSNPFAEFAILHLRLLSGSDRFAGLVQWSACAGSIAGVSLIAGRLTGITGGRPDGLTDRGTRGGVIAAVFAATLPMGALQASSTQTDYVAAFWLVCFVYFMLESMEGGGAGPASAAGAAAGLAILTKATAYSLALPFALWYAVEGIRRRRAGLLRDILIMAALVVLLNCGHVWRNTSLYGHPAAPSSDRKLMVFNGNSLPLVVSNIVKNAALHLGTPFPSVNAFVERAVLRVHALMDVDVNDERTTIKIPGYYFNIPFSNHESRAGNPLHFILAGVCLCVLFFSGRRRLSGVNGSKYAAAIMAGALIFCISVKWMPVNSRYHLLHFVLTAPLAGAVLAGLTNRRIVNVVAIILLAASLPWVFYNATRPLLGPNNVFKVNRIDRYFVKRPLIKVPYEGAAEFVSQAGCADIGLMIYQDWEFDWWEYPLWVLLKAQNPGVRLQSVGVTDPSGALSAAPPFNDFAPCAVISIQAAGGDTMTIDGKIFTRAWSKAPVDVYLAPRPNP